MRPRTIALPVAVVLGVLTLAQTPPPTCPTLPAGYSIRPGMGPHAAEDTLTLVPPYTVRVDRRAARPSHCEITLSACGADNTWTADDVIAAITDPAVRVALSSHSVFGDVRHGAPFVLNRGSDSMTVGAPCGPTSGTSCTAIPVAVARMLTVLQGIYRYRLVPPECATL